MEDYKPQEFLFHEFIDGVNRSRGSGSRREDIDIPIEIDLP